MHTEKAFAEAEKHGYVIPNRILHATCEPEKTLPSYDIDRDYYFALHDPSFWEALGFARGWKQIDRDKAPKWIKEEGTGLVVFYPDDSWASWQHRYLDHAIEHGYSKHQQFFKQFYEV